VPICFHQSSGINKEKISGFVCKYEICSYIYYYIKLRFVNCCTINEYMMIIMLPANTAPSIMSQNQLSQFCHCRTIIAKAQEQSIGGKPTKADIVVVVVKSGLTIASSRILGDEDFPRGTSVSRLV